MTKTDLQNSESIPLQQFAENAYLNYSMYVIMDRALPFIGDGLKPVQRRIIYAMSELGLNATAKFKKSARTVGDVLGKYHPHGDSACYEAMVLMAQSFSYRYPLVDGQGNWGAPDDPKSFAAMRYTESRLSRYSELLLHELGSGTVDFVPNFDGTLEEPKVLPARLPNILLNGTMGIAVGMATDIPPHNAREVADALLLLLDKPNATLDDVLSCIQGPDYPTEAEIITPNDEIKRLYEHGKGSVRMRAAWKREQDNIVITALPHQVSGSKILEQIAQQMRAKKLPLLEDLRDESDHENPMRLVLIQRSNRIDVEQLMSHLFATTDLERSYRVNLNMIGLDNRPSVKGLIEILTEWLSYRRMTITRRLSYRLEQVLRRLHILDSLLIAFLNIDEVIAIIRTEEHPKTVLMQRFTLSEKQSEAILELKLRHLAKLEEFRIRTEQSELGKERDTLQQLLDSPKKLTSLIKKEITLDAKNYGDDRRSPIVVRQEAKQIQEADLTPSESISVILSGKGWVRMAKGHEIDPLSLSYKAGDHFLTVVRGRSNIPILFLDSTGRSYALEGQSLPSVRGQGEPLTGKLSLPDGASITHMVAGQEEQRYLLVSDAGYGFICTYQNMLTRNRNGKVLISLPTQANIMPPLLIEQESALLLALTGAGRMLIFPVADLPVLSKGKGNKVISIAANDFTAGKDKIIHLALMTETSHLTFFAGKRKLILKPNDWRAYLSERGRKGTRLPRGLQRITSIDIEAV